ncbi:NUDIX hydrolase [Arcticibacterium luteifluviistationis]|uniref:CoA pyrophosphatase n=1 Tax=Arcticibacterium luteifluviistationis TaxID=1784714 RepID=A0A2Z4GHE9_9BACT|nr:CoA pyrophosphatase [Arcticibacterium luteifluviistationis]AWW00445.1 CoA pyrophosphatase [Arcticibacterium luteifluviistationis]
MNFNSFINYLETKLQEPLPGHADFLERNGYDLNKRQKPNLNKIKKSAILIAFYPHQGDIYLPLILRPPYDGTHGGQMAFPGGRMEDFDESYERTALREAEEEIGLKALDVNIIGNLTEVYIAPSNYWVKPIIGTLDYSPSFFPDKREVAAIHKIPWSEFSIPDRLQKRTIQVRGTKMVTTGFEIQGQWIWGATALMIAELMQVLKS